MGKGPMAALMNVIGGVIAIVAFFYTINAVDTSAWGSIDDLVKALVPLALAIATVFMAFRAMKGGTGE